MKTILIRITLVAIAIVLGTSIFLLLAYAGDKTKGPLDDLMTTVNSSVAKFEKHAVDTRESRSTSLKWFDRYRNSAVVMNKPDSFFIGAYDDNTAESYESIIALEDSIKNKLPIISLYTAWGSKKTEVFPTLRAEAIYDLGSMPMITWEPWLDDFDPDLFPADVNAASKNKGGMKAIAEGKFDDYINKWAAEAKNFRHPFFLRFGHEMNDPYRYPWGPQNNKPEDFIAGWRHIKDRFKAIGATNVIWVWSPHPAYPYSDFYPGHDYVDWIGTTTINYGTVATWSQWWTFDDIFGKFYADVSLYGKPIILTEIGSLEVGGDRAEWFRKAFYSIRHKYRKVKALVFFHVANDNTTTYKSLDWSFKDDHKTTEVIRRSLDSWKAERGF
jgi:hypothetical protein